MLADQYSSLTMSYNLSYEKDQKYPQPDHLDLSERNQSQNMASYRAATSDSTQGNVPSYTEAPTLQYQPGRSYRHATGEADIPEEPDSPDSDTTRVGFKVAPHAENSKHKPIKSLDNGTSPARKMLFIAIGLAILFLILSIVFLAVWLTSSKDQDVVQAATGKILQTSQAPPTTTPMIPNYGERIIGNLTINGENVTSFTLTSSSGVTAELISIGARVNALKSGGIDVVIGFDLNTTTSVDYQNTTWGSTLGNLCGGNNLNKPGSDPEGLSSINFRSERMVDGIKFSTTITGVSVEVFYTIEEKSLKVTRRASALRNVDIDLCSSLNFNLALTDVSSMQLMVPASYVQVFQSPEFVDVNALTDFGQSKSLSDYVAWASQSPAVNALTYKINGVGTLLHVATLRNSNSLVTVQVWSSTRYLTVVIPVATDTPVISGKGEYGRNSYISVATHAYPKASIIGLQKPEVLMRPSQTYESSNEYTFVD